MENTETAIAIKDDQKVLTQSNDLVVQANAIVIKNDLGCQQASDIAKTLKLFIEGPGTYHDEEIELANALHKKLCQKRNAIIDGPKAAYKVLKDRIASYLHEQEVKRQEAQRRAEEEARRIEAEKQAKIQAKIDEENRKIREAEEAEAEKRREEQRKINAEKNKEKAAQMKKEEEDRKKDEAIRREQERIRQEEKIAALQEKKEAVYVAPKTIAPVSTPTGASISFTWDAKVINRARVPEQYKIVDIAMLEKMQKAAKGAMNVPGIEFTKRPVGSLRR
jgi:flagellar biosynthesis GTPase FlhF